jgi:pimeloyl-ACP methyl ester carboxylesterase
MRILGSLTFLVIFFSGCATPPQPYVTDSRLERGLVIVLPGIEGRSVFNEEICRGLNAGGVDSAIELYDWTSGVPLAFIWNIWASDSNHQKAADIAERIARYQFNHPERPVVLVGQSGGAAIATWTCESMRWGRQVDGVVMLAAALSPGYRLTTALDSSKRGMVNFYSSRDVLLLWAGTKVIGTMDGKHSTSAGKVGFSVPPEKLRPKEYDKLFQVPWRPAMSETGHIGMHLTSGTAKFVARYVAPLVRAKQWNRAVLDRIIQTPPPAAPTLPLDGSS